MIDNVYFHEQEIIRHNVCLLLFVFKKVSSVSFLNFFLSAIAVLEKLHTTKFKILIITQPNVYISIKYLYIFGPFIA